jgi:DNA-binding SARP family transcriptional activator
VLVRLAGLPGAEPALRADAKAALRRLTTEGVRVPGSGPDEAEPASSVSVRVLGSFEVRVNGREVPHAAWRSRQARSLLKILAAARGRPLTRDHLCEALWPDDLSDKTGHRLSVLLSAVRNVLDPDRRCASDHYLRTDLDAVRLDLRHVRLDLEELLRDAREADALARRGQQHRALELLAEVEAGYRGEAFEDEPYEQWAEIPREEARAAWSGATRLAARLARWSGQADLAVGHLVRLLSSDPYDADVHRTLVDLLLEAGRHGEARRRLELWAKAMHEIGAPHPDHRLANAGNTDQAKRSRPRAAERALGRRADPLLTPR